MLWCVLVAKLVSIGYKRGYLNLFIDY